MFDFLFSLFSNDMGIDLGTATTLVYVKGQGIVLREPSVVAYDKDTQEIKAIGEEAKRMVGKTPASIEAIRPLRNGVIADFDITEKMIRYFIKKVHTRKTLLHPRIVIGIPSGITEVERRAVREAAEQAGAREVYLIEEPMAAAIGAGLPIHEPTGNMIIDIGGGTTEAAVISLGGMVISKSIPIAGDEMDEAIVTHFKKNHNLAIGYRTAEEIKIKIGSVFTLQKEESLDVKGLDLAQGLPRTINISSKEIRTALVDTVTSIVEMVKGVLEITPAEIAAELVDRGIVMAGGGSLIRGMTDLISRETHLPVYLAQDPTTCVVLGTGRYLEELENIRKARKRLE
ncbi:MAG: rod shape-determining protein [Elusimicrobia bacterium RIFOXYC2_FULL_34_12]|nr:MAG: rod shape-determining protein [Elusimicrobia bacterium RIFOXYC2_FULL_34_12]OGS38562.1 MAG: rod shape-determining protein [Elusimicrobia bacterium RIFOXYD2_FULL_34_30]HAM38829.1 rod shape-determining protein [Elusimicrobiota bacterium]